MISGRQGKPHLWQIGRSGTGALRKKGDENVNQKPLRMAYCDLQTTHKASHPQLRLARHCRCSIQYDVSHTRHPLLGRAMHC